MYSKNATRREQLYIQSRSDRLGGDFKGAIEKLETLIREEPTNKQSYFELSHLYYYNLRDYRKAINIGQRIIELDPSASYVLLAYSYATIGVVDSAFWAIDKHVAQNPDDPNAHDTRADLLLGEGMIDRAIESYKDALAVDLDFYISRLKLGHLSLHKRDYAEARAYFQTLTKSPSPDGRGRGRLGLAFIPLYQGKLEEALDVLDAGISADEMEGYTGSGYAYKLISKASIYIEQGRPEQTLVQAVNLATLYQEPWWMHFACYLFAACKDLSRAEQALLDVRGAIADTTAARSMYPYWTAKAWIEMEKGLYDEACTTLENTERRWFIHSDYPLGLAYLEAGRLADAVSMFEFICVRRFSTGDQGDYVGLWIPRTHYYLAIAYQESGWRDKAIKQYEDFLDMWRDADPDLEILQDARRRLGTLRAGY
jgi:tetratricopeptide (TPR) repeat protein